MYSTAMTVVVAVKSGSYLQPAGRQISFEPGIVMAGDTRVSLVGGKQRLLPEDNHVKVDSIGDFAIAGYAGNREIATSALVQLEDKVKQVASPNKIASMVQTTLQDAYKAHGKGKPEHSVQLLVGVRDREKTGAFVLYEFDSQDEFKPHARDGMAAIGSHGIHVKNMFECIRKYSAMIPGDPFGGPQFTLKENLASLVWVLLENLLETASEIEGSDSLIGGKTHLAVLDAAGVQVLNPPYNSGLVL